MLLLFVLISNRKWKISTGSEHVHIDDLICVCKIIEIIKIIEIDLFLLYI